MKAHSPEKRKPGKEARSAVGREVLPGCCQGSEQGHDCNSGWYNLCQQYIVRQEINIYPLFAYPADFSLSLCHKPERNKTINVTSLSA